MDGKLDELGLPESDFDIDYKHFLQVMGEISDTYVHELKATDRDIELLHIHHVKERLEVSHTRINFSLLDFIKELMRRISFFGVSGLHHDFEFDDIK